MAHKMKVYLSGPMTGLPEWNYPAFNELAEHLRSEGHEVFNPAEAFDGETSYAWTTYMREDIKRIMEADYVVVLNGWEKSAGARLEVAVARSIGLPVMDVAGVFIYHMDARADVAQVLGMTQSQDQSVLDEAKQLVHGNRGDDYGHPWHDFSRTAGIWTALLGVPVTPEQVALCMIGVKMSRQINKPKRDNPVDIAGYAETLWMCMDYRDRLD